MKKVKKNLKNILYCTVYREYLLIIDNENDSEHTSNLYVEGKENIKKMKITSILKK